jgi:hypothetical protein
MRNNIKLISWTLNRCNEEYLTFIDARTWVTSSIQPTPDAPTERARKLVDFHKTAGDFYRFTIEGERVKATRDFGRLPKLPQRCRVEQLARFDDHKQIIHIDSELWKIFDSLNRVALYAHEFFYRRYRNAGETNSELARKLLAAVFARRPKARVRDGVPERALFCRGEGLGMTMNTEFFLFPNPLRSGETVLQFVSVSGRETLWPTRAYLPFHLDERAIQNHANDGAKIIDPRISFTGRVPLEGGPLEVYSVNLRFEFNEPIELTLLKDGSEAG